MTFFERYEQLCAEQDFKPQSQKSFEIAGVTTGSVTGWKNGATPKGDVLCRIATYFGVTTDYLLCLSEVRKPSISLSAEEMLLLSAYREADTQGRFHIIQVCMNEREAAEKRNAVSAG